MRNGFQALREELRAVSSPKKAKASQWFFKTGEGQYGFGDKFLGVTVPEQRMLAKKYKDLSLDDIEKLLESEFHEERLTALIILVMQFQKADQLGRDKIFQFYFLHSKYVNNWDLVDTSSPAIVGEFLIDKKITLLLALAKSQKLWERRIAMVATLAFIRQEDMVPTFRIADILLDDKEDLIQKAVGWMLREAGKKAGEKVLKEYLKLRYKKMGRTALRYSIEKFDAVDRRKYLDGNV